MCLWAASPTSFCEMSPARASCTRSRARSTEGRASRWPSPRRGTPANGRRDSHQGPSREQLTTGRDAPAVQIGGIPTISKSPSISPCVSCLILSMKWFAKTGEKPPATRPSTTATWRSRAATCVVSGLLLPEVVVGGIGDLRQGARPYRVAVCGRGSESAGGCDSLDVRGAPELAGSR